MADDGGRSAAVLYGRRGRDLDLRFEAGARGIAAELDAYLPNGAQFAFEKAGFRSGALQPDFERIARAV
jgi:hypothetical protein